MRFERGGETLLSAVGCPLSAGEGDGQAARLQTGIALGNASPRLRLVTGGREISGLYSVEMTGRRQGV